MPLCGWGCTVGPGPGTKGAGFSSIISDGWAGYPDRLHPEEGFVHEWLHQVESVLRSRGVGPDVLPGLHDVDGRTSCRSVDLAAVRPDLSRAPPGHRHVAALVPGPDDRHGPRSRLAASRRASGCDRSTGRRPGADLGSCGRRPRPALPEPGLVPTPFRDPRSIPETRLRPVVPASSHCRPAARSGTRTVQTCPAVQRRPAGPPLVGIAAFVVVVIGLYLASGDRHDAPAVGARGDPRRADHDLGPAARLAGLGRRWSSPSRRYVGVLVVVGLITAIGIFRLLDELPTDTTELQAQLGINLGRLAGGRDHRRRVRLGGGIDRPVGARRAGGRRLQRDHRRLPAARAADDRTPASAGRSAIGPPSRTGPPTSRSGSGPT